MIFEAPTDPFVLGSIDAWGDVRAQIARDDKSSHPQGWERYKTWRFVPDIGLLMWWETPDEGEKLTVEDWLERKGYEVRVRSVMGQQLRMRENLNEGPWAVVVGSIGMQGELRSKETRKTHTELGIQRGKCWRYNPLTKTVYWSDDGSGHSQDDEFTVENHLHRQYGYVAKQQKNLENNVGDADGYWNDHNIAHGYMTEIVKSLKGSTIKRFQNNVGKLVGTQIYVHRKYANEVIPTEILRFAAETLKKLKPGFRFNSVMWNRETNAVRFDEAPDFDTAREPHVGKYITISPDGTAKEGQSNSIWHHKWLWVKDDYQGFDVDKARQWSTLWLSKLPAIAKGTDVSFGSQLKDIGLSEQINLKELLMNEDKQDEAALDFLKQMVRKGPFKGQVYLAGGAVRDMVRGEVPKDLDIVVTDHGEKGGMEFATWLAQQMGNYKEGSNPVLFPTFGTAKVVLTGEHNGVSLDGFDVEAVFARKEVYTPGSRKPQVFPGTIEDDAFRRDFTANSLMIDLTTDEMLDITGKGKQDIAAGIIRTTSNPNEIFGQDALRMFRAVRFASKYKWKIDPETWDGIKNNLQLLITNNTSKERIADELSKMLTHANPDLAMELLNDLGLLPYLGKEFQQMVNMTQNKHHVDAEGNPVTVFKHTINVLKGTRPDLLERLIALFHDIGKVVTRTVTPKGVQFLGHEAEGPAIAERIMRDLKFPLEIINAVKLGVAEHMKLKPGKDDAVALSDATLRKFKIKLGKNLETLLRVIHADNMAHAPASQMPNQIANVIKRIQALNIPEAPELPYDGNEIMRKFGVSGEAVGILQDMLVNVWYKKGKLSEHDADAVIKGVMKELPRLIQQKRDKKKPK